MGKSAISVAMILVLAGCVGQAEEPAKPASSTSEAPAPTVPAKGVEEPSEKKEETAAAVLERAVAKYASAKTYRDAGRCTNVFYTADSEMTDVKSFTTAFERGGKVHYQFQHSRAPGQDATQRFAMWSTDGVTYGWAWTIRSQYETGKPAAEVFARASRQSGMAATIVLPLLIDGTGLTRMTMLEGAAIAGKEVVGAVECTKVSGKLPDGSSAAVWIAGDGTVWKGAMEQVMQPPADGKAPAATALTKVLTTITLDRAEFDLVIPARALEGPPAPPAKPVPKELPQGTPASK